MRAVVSGLVVLADAQAMADLLKPGQPFHQALVLNLIDKATEYTPESRHHFTTMKGTYKRMASVVTSPVVRATINFQLRVAGEAGEFQLFDSEAEALAWLDAE